MRPRSDPRRPRWTLLGALPLLLWVAWAPAAGAARAASPYPAGASRPLIEAGAAASAAGHVSRAKSTSAARSSRGAKKKSKAKKPLLRGDPARALLAFEAMQKYYYLPESGLYAGEPYSYLWPFSQALAATVSMDSIPALKRTIPALRSTLAKEVHLRLIGLASYLDTSNSEAPEGTFTSSLSAFDGTVAPPAGPGGAKFYDDNEWVGIELARLYKLTHNAAVLGSAEGIMAFEMAGWSTQPNIACPGGIPFDNEPENHERNTITNAPVAELGVQLFKITGNTQDLQFAEMAYEWVRRCLLQPNGMYADHINHRGIIEPALWSYNQGAMIGAGTLLYQATGNSAYLYQARQTAKAALPYFTLERLRSENPFFPSVYFRNLLYLDSVTHDPPDKKLPQAYVNYAWQNLRLSNDLFVSGSPAQAQLLAQAAIAQIYALLSSPASTHF